MELAAETKASTLALELADTLARINSRSATHVKLSTMTIVARTTVHRVCRDSMAIAASLVDGDGPLGLSVSKHRKRPRLTFYNQITLKHGSKSIKVFDNGTMHVTGCASLEEFSRVVKAVCTLMEETAGIAECVRVTDFDIQMMNLNLCAGKPLYLREMHDICSSMGLTASYDADVYPGLNVKLMVGDRRVTVLMFKSGKVIMTGAKAPTELDEAHKIITDVLARSSGDVDVAVDVE